MHDMDVNDLASNFGTLPVFAETETAGVWIMGYIESGGFPGKLKGWPLIIFFPEKQKTLV